MRLFRTLLLLMLVASVVPTVMVGWATLSDTRALLVRDAQELAQERVKQLTLRTASLVDGPSRAVAGLAGFPRFGALPLHEQQAHLGALLNHRPELRVVTVLDPDGKKLTGLQAFAVQDISPTAVAEHDARTRALLDGPYPGLRYSQVYTHPPSAEPVLTVVMPMAQPSRGFVAAEISLAALAQLFSKQRVGSSGVALVVDRAGRLVAGGAGLQAARTGTDLSARPAVAHFLESFARAGGAESFQVGNFGVGDDRVVGAYSVLPDVGWAVVSEQPIELAYGQVSRMERRLLVTVLGALGVATLLAALFSRQVTRPLKGFIAGALELAKGKFGVQVKVEQKNELGELAQTFNYMSQQMLASNTEMRALYESLEKGYLETIVALANSIDSKDAYTRGHSQRVGDVAVEIGAEMGLSQHELRLLLYGGILHDVGKIGIVDAILCKQSRLTDEEMGVMREHPAIGDGIISAITLLAPVKAAVRSHHERWDGKGYPDGLKGKEIPLIARIVNCADTFDACTSTRPYQKAMSLERAMEVMEKLRGSQLDPDVLDGLRRVLQKKGVRVEGSSEPVKLAS